MHQQLSDATLALCETLVNRPSITPEDGGCQAIIAKRLTAMGFSFETWEAEGVTNSWARRGNKGPLLAFAGHTDVVPPGPEEQWISPPFTATVESDKVYGRGVADMKGGIAAMIVALEAWLGKHPDFDEASLGVMLTSDEEGNASFGTRVIMEKLTERGENIDYCIVGEPSSGEAVGDAIRVGRRGSLHMDLLLHGKQGHIAYPHLAANPIHLAPPIIQALTEHTWDDGYKTFPPTSFQIASIHAGESTNVIPGQVKIHANFRFCPANTVEVLQETTALLLADYPLEYELKWHLSAQPFYSEPGKLTHTAQQAIMHTTGIEAQLSTGGGTSDGRFIAPTGTEVIELGLRNHTIHHVNEYTDVEDLGILAKIYLQMLKTLFDSSENL